MFVCLETEAEMELECPFARMCKYINQSITSLDGLLKKFLDMEFEACLLSKVSLILVNG